MLNSFLKKYRHHHKPLAALGLVLLITSCTASEAPPDSATETPNNPSEETVVTETETNTEISTPKTNNVPTQQTSATNTETLLKSFEQGTPYAVVRAQLLKAGWTPAEVPEPGAFGVEREAYDSGFIEVSACAGTGMGQCRFELVNLEKQKGLSITTYGGSDLQFGDWSIYPYTSAEVAPPSDGNITVSNPIIQEGRSEIPSQFQGEWNANLDGCGSLSSDGRLVIKPSQLQFYASTGTVSKIMVTGTAGLTVTAEYSGEGSTWTETDNFQLSSDLSTLTNLDTGGVRYRCSS
ncbi:hypothetical protein [[Limnothrix rosea] IAM M-220]|uniref:hypothetical protein n=1 Tax=[Limnothrix rosea] IAM M-220 TaxID=454133 RepID=UPI000966F06F|nr:hypothetical protein [[Limnothrix rosea] IAM M-220]OKH17441.1 hypothetical protein NIES208_09505 [[Limnothrix rosea] IAM M-220]